MRFRHWAAAAVLAPLTLASRAVAGDGQIDLILSPTTKTTISSSGSYVLVSDVTTTSNNFTILSITADHVTVDLNGHTIKGTPGSGSQSGILGSGSDVVIFNGVILDSSRGIFTQESRWTVRGVTVKGCSNGIVLGAGSIVEDCNASGNGGGIGIAVWDDSTVRGCRSTDNVVTGGALSSVGIHALKNCIIENNVCLGNVAYPSQSVTGITAGDGSRISGNVCSENSAGSTGTAIGIEVGDGAIISGNTVRSNNAGTAYGIKAGSGCLIKGNNVQSNNTATFTGTTYGISVQGNCKIERNLCADNLATDGTCYGMHLASTGNIVDANDLRSNAGASSYGIHVNAIDNLLRGNATVGHTTNGILLNVVGIPGSACRAERNRVGDGFLAIGIHSLGSGEDANIGF